MTNCIGNINNTYMQPLPMSVLVSEHNAYYATTPTTERNLLNVKVRIVLSHNVRETIKVFKTFKHRQDVKPPMITSGSGSHSITVADPGSGQEWSL